MGVRARSEGEALSHSHTGGGIQSSARSLLLPSWLSGGMARYCCSRCSHCEEGTSLLLSSGGRPDSPPRFLWHHPSEEDQGISLSQGGGEVVTTDRGGWCLYIEMKVPASYLPQCHSIRGSKCLVTHCLARVEI